MTVHVECPCGWSQDVDLQPRARITINHVLADHAREHVTKGEAYQVPRVTFDA